LVADVVDGPLGADASETETGSAEVIVSTSSVPNTPWPVSNFQERVSMPPPAWPLNSSDQTCFQGPFVPA